MKFCIEHWSKLRAALTSRGLDRFIAKDGEEAARRLGRAKSEADSFEPLMGAHNAIVANALDSLGLGLLMADENGNDRCPICSMQSQCKCGKPDCREAYERWIEHAANDQLENGKRLGFVELA